MPPVTASTPPVRPGDRYRRAADLTALRLGRAVLAYLALTTFVITLAPFRFQPAPAHGFTTVWTWFDLVMNVLMFVPFGFVHQLTRPRGVPANWRAVLLLGAGLSGSIELAQLFAPDRFSSLLDVATNTAGALLGAALCRAASRRLAREAAVQSLALELPLMGLVYLLVPLAWLLGLGSAGDERRVLLLLLAVVAGAVLGTVFAGYVDREAPPGTAPAGRWLVGLPIGWALAATVPGARGEWAIVAASASVAVAAAGWRRLATRRHGARGNRRFEAPTLRLLLPVMVMYLSLSSLWPLTDASLTFVWSLSLAPADVPLSQTLVYRALEHLAAFTLVGYVGAEWHGRDARRRTLVAPRVLAFTAVAALLLEAARGFHAGYGASVLLFGLTQAAGVFGAYVYVLQRAHVRALLARRALVAARAASAPAGQAEAVARAA